MACLLVLEDSITAKNNNNNKKPTFLSADSPLSLIFGFLYVTLTDFQRNTKVSFRTVDSIKKGALPKALLLWVGHRMILGSLNAKCESEERWAPDFLKSEGTDSSRHSAGAIWLIEISHHHWESEVVTTPVLSPQETVTRGHSGVQGHSLCSGQQGCIASSCLQIKHNFSTEFHLMTDKRTLKVDSHKLPA